MNRLFHIIIVAGFSFLLFNISGSTSAQVSTVETVSLVLDGSMLIANSYNEPFGAGNGVYITAPDGTPPANNVPYYLWPGGTQENLNTNMTAPANGTAPVGTGVWQPTTLPANDGKVEVLIHPDEIFGNGAYTLADVNSITWETNKTTAQNQPDWYINIWLDAGGGDVAFLSGEPYWADNLNGPANTWNTWTADNTAGGTNEITFHEPGFACTSFGWATGGSFGPMPTLDQLTSGSWTWNNVPSQNFLPGCGATPNPLTTTINYSTMPILGISIATGNPWAGAFTGLVDNLQIELDDPTVAGRVNQLNVDFEPAAPVNEPLIDKTFNTDPIVVGGTSTLQFIIVNPNLTALGGLSVVDNLPAGLEVATAPNITNNCGGIITANAGATSITLDGGSVTPSSSCAFSVDVTGTAAGTFVNVTSSLTTTTINFPNDTGTVTATDTITVNAPPPAQTIIVRPTTLQGWGITDFPVSSAAEFAFEAGPATPPLGTGSLESTIPSAGTKIIFARTAAEYANLPLSGLTGLSFDTYNDATGGSTQTNSWYINLYISTLGNGTYDCRLDFATTQTTFDTWQSFDAFTGTWSGNGAGCVGFNGTLATFLGNFPNAEFNAFSNPAEPTIRFNQGDTSTTYVGYVGNIDNVRIAHNAVGDITWDFEPPAPPVVNPPVDPVTDANPQIDVFDPAISKIGFLVPGQVGVTGEQLEWVVTISNTGAVAGQNVVVTDTLVDALQVDSVDAPNANVSINGQTVTVTYPTLNVGETAQFSIFTTVLDGVSVTNTACVTADNQSAEECATGSSILQLPNTGETPRWVWNSLILLTLILSGGLAGNYIWRGQRES